MENYMMWQDWVAMIAAYVLCHCMIRIYATVQWTSAMFASGRPAKCNLSVEMVAASISFLVIYWHLFVV